MYKKCVRSSEKTHCLKICRIYLTFRCERFEHVTCQNFDLYRLKKITIDPCKCFCLGNEVY